LGFSPTPGTPQCVEQVLLVVAGEATRALEDEIYAYPDQRVLSDPLRLVSPRPVESAGQRTKLIQLLRRESGFLRV
jgi:hypothetical protein